MPFQLDKINPKFRQLTDLLFFSDRIDLDLIEFKNLLKENIAIHFEYFWDRFRKCSEMFWENGEQFWSHRLSFLLSLNEKNIIDNLYPYLERRMALLMRSQSAISIKHNVEYLQFVEFCKIKASKKENIFYIKNFLIDMPSHVNTITIINVINSLIPFVFSDYNEYTEAISKKITHSSRNFDLLIALEKNGLKFNRAPMVKLVKELILERVLNDKNRRSFFTLINDEEILSLLKKDYNKSFKKKLITLLNSCDYSMIEEYHLRNIKNIINLDPTIADELASIYADKLYIRGTGHKKANADRLIRMLRIFPQISSRKILAYLSSNNKMSDIKYILTSFPELKKLAVFV